MTFADYVRLSLHKAKSEANEWDRTRTLMSYILNTSVSKKSDQKKPKEILPLPIIDKYQLLKAKRITTEQDKKEMIAKYGR